MSKIALIVQREYLSRVRKRSFIIMTIIGPLLFAAFLILPVWLSQVEDKGEKVIAVLESDEFGEPKPDSLRFFDVIPNMENLKFEYVPARLDALKRVLSSSKYDAVLFIPYNVIHSETVELYTKKQPSLGIEVHITESLEKYIYNLKLRKNNIPPEILKSVRTNIAMKTIRLEKDGSYQEQNQQDMKRWVGYIGGFLVYFFIFFFGAQVMRGVIEEKTSRILELIVSSVKPFQLMMGKIIGVGLVGLTQFLIWIILTFGIVFSVQYAVGSGIPEAESSVMTPESIFETKPVQDRQYPAEGTTAFQDYMKGLGEVPLFKIIASFIFYFLGGFVLYGSLFAAVGAASDSETDTQQFILPVTIPLILGFIIMLSAFTNPEGQIAIIFSIIPLTSPVVMMGRIGFDIPLIQILVSMLVLVITFLGTTWLAGKIYRTGILMYGKKVSYRELWKWIRYRN